jgi:hypothetical protein
MIFLSWILRNIKTRNKKTIFKILTLERDSVAIFDPSLQVYFNDDVISSIGYDYTHNEEYFSKKEALEMTVKNIYFYCEENSILNYAIHY